MNVSLRVPRMTRDQFLDWAERQEMPYEFDGFEPIAMTGGTRRHGRLCANLLITVSNHLTGGAFEALMEAGLATIGEAVRYPDAVILPAGGDQNERMMPGVIVVFEVMSPGTGRLDLTIKLREYRAVPSIRRYVVVSSTEPGLIVFSRPSGTAEWMATKAIAGETLSIPEVGIELQVDDIFTGIVFETPTA